MTPWDERTDMIVHGYGGAPSVSWFQRITVRAEPDNYIQATANRLLAPDAAADAAGPGDGRSLGRARSSAAVGSGTA